MGPSVCPFASFSVHNPYRKYALQVKVQLGYASLGQVGSGGVSWGQVGQNECRMGQEGPKGVKSGQIRAQVGSSGKCGLVR